MPHPSDSDTLAFFATCPRNTEGLVLDELRELGAASTSETRSGVAFSGPLSLAYKACLWSRIASRVLMRLQSFPVAELDDLYDGVHRMPWEDHLASSGTLAVDVTSTISRGPLADVNTHFAELRVKDAVVDRFRARTGTRPSVDLARPSLRLNIHLAPTETTVSLDLSGGPLHRRGYRLEAGEAPLKENVAAAILVRAGWKGIAETGGALVDPMCGSGTMLLEGALIAGDVAPGLLRAYYGFFGWKGFERPAWDDLLREAEERRESGLRTLPKLFGFDAEARAVSIARANARRAGLAGRVFFETRDLASLSSPVAGPGLVATNPPYGKRLGEVRDLTEVYETLGERLKTSFAGWEAAIITGNPELSAHLGLRAHRVNVLYNGPIECKLLLFHIGPPRTRKSSGADTAAGEGNEGTPEGSPFENRLRKNLKHLRRWAAREDIHCYRLYDADIPEYAVAVDLYEDWAHVQEYAPPGDIDPVRARRRLKEAVAAVPGVLGIPAAQVALKVRRPQRGADQYQKVGDQQRFLEVREGGLRFLVNLSDYLDTGLFLDHRQTRALIRDLAPGRRFLNLFAYTGSATVYAAAGGAATTTSVDLSTTYLDWARRNLELNGFSGAAHSFVRADCLEWLGVTGQATAGRRGAVAGPRSGSYDLIFLDAPTFSNSKSMTTELDIQRDHPQLIRAALRLLSPGGILLFSTNFRRFKLDADLAQQHQVADITKQTIPPDFARNSRIHACFRFTLDDGRAH
jgi:23S rRNA (guanine2445-N2)-methyltransferase / 23S rRNA (guanine2069-N7)-methyltransferase